MRRRRNTTDWEDLPPTFAPLPRPGSAPDDWADLPPMFAPPPSSTLPVRVTRPTQPPVVIHLKPMFPWHRHKLVQALDAIERLPDVGHLVASARSTDEQGDFLVFPDMETVCLVRHAVWKLVGDTSQDDNVRTQALEIEKAMDAQTEGRSAACLVRMVGNLQLAGGMRPTSLRVVQRGQRRPVRMIGYSPGLVGIEAAIAQIQSVFDAQYRASWEWFGPIDEVCTEETCGRDADEDCIHLERLKIACRDAMHEVAILLQKAGAESWIMVDYDNYPDSHYVVWFRNPGEECLFWEVSKEVLGTEVTVWPLEAIDEEEFYELVEYGCVNFNPPRRTS